jgi:hypothetical protein
VTLLAKPPSGEFAMIIEGREDVPPRPPIR